MAGADAIFSMRHLLERFISRTVNSKNERLNYYQGIGIALLVIGIILTAYGFNASDSASLGIARVFTGAPTNKTLWLLFGGVASAIVGAVMAFRPSGKAQKSRTGACAKCNPCALCNAGESLTGARFFKMPAIAFIFNWHEAS